MDGSDITITDNKFKYNKPILYTMKAKMIYSILSIFNTVTQTHGLLPRTRQLVRNMSMKYRMDADPYRKTDYEFCTPKNPRQQKYIDTLNNKTTKIVFAIGPAGTGKTLIACNHAMKLLKTRSIEKIVITRPIVPVEEEELGFLPGNINKKMDPWMRPIFDIFLESYSQKELDRLIYDNVIEIAPLAFMRGRTFKNTFIIGDEMQNSSPNQMKMLLTRLGESSKMVVTGDVQQNDISNKKISGLEDIVEKTRRYVNFIEKKYNTCLDASVQIVEFTPDHIERSKVVRRVLDIYNIDKVVYSTVGEEKGLL